MIANMHTEPTTLLARTKSPAQFESYSSKLESAMQLNVSLAFLRAS